MASAASPTPPPPEDVSAERPDGQAAVLPFVSRGPGGGIPSQSRWGAVRTSVAQIRSQEFQAQLSTPQAQLSREQAQPSGGQASRWGAVRTSVARVRSQEFQAQLSSAHAQLSSGQALPPPGPPPLGPLGPRVTGAAAGAPSPWRRVRTNVAKITSEEFQAQLSDGQAPPPFPETRQPSRSPPPRLASVPEADEAFATPPGAQANSRTRPRLAAIMSVNDILDPRQPSKESRDQAGNSFVNLVLEPPPFGHADHCGAEPPAASTQPQRRNVGFFKSSGSNSNLLGSATASQLTSSAPNPTASQTTNGSGSKDGTSTWLVAPPPQQGRFGKLVDRLRRVSADSHNSAETNAEDDDDSLSDEEGEEEFDLDPMMSPAMDGSLVRKGRGRARLNANQRAIIRRRVEDQLGVCDDRSEEAISVRIQRMLFILQIRLFIETRKQLIEEEPPAFPTARDLVRSLRFEAFIAVLIVLNGVLIGWDTMYKPGETKPMILPVMEHVFTVIFFIEFVLRLMAYSWVWVFTPMNAFDTFLIIVTGVLVNWVLTPMGINADVLQRLAAFRVLRLGRLCRAVRMMPQFHELWMLVQGVMECMSLLFWAAMIIFIIHYTFAVAVLEIVTKSETFLEDEVVQDLFGDLHASMYTLFQIMTFDSWAGIVRPIIYKMPESIPLFLLFVGIAGFVLFNLMTAIVVKNAFDAAAEDEEAVAQMKQDAHKRHQQALLEMFQELDKDDSGMLTQQEFAESVLEDMVFIHQLKTLDIELEELPDVFEILDDGDGQVSTEEFCSGLMRMQGNAMSRDMLKATKRAKVVNGQFHTVHSAMYGLAAKTMTSIEASLDDSHNNFVEMQAMTAEVLKKLDAIGLRRAVKAVAGVLPSMEEPDGGTDDALKAARHQQGEMFALKAEYAKKHPDTHMPPLPADWVSRRREETSLKAISTKIERQLSEENDEDRVPCVAQEFQPQWEKLDIWRPEMALGGDALRAAAKADNSEPLSPGAVPKMQKGVRSLPPHLVEKKDWKPPPTPTPPSPAARSPASPSAWRRQRHKSPVLHKTNGQLAADHPHAVPSKTTSV